MGNQVIQNVNQGKGLELLELQTPLDTGLTYTPVMQDDRNIQNAQDTYSLRCGYVGQLVNKCERICKIKINELPAQHFPTVFFPCPIQFNL